MKIAACITENQGIYVKISMVKKSFFYQQSKRNSVGHSADFTLIKSELEETASMDGAALPRQQAFLLSQQAPFANLTVIAVAWLMALVFGQYDFSGLLQVWAGVISFFSGIRLVLWWRYQRGAESISVHRWIRQYTWATLFVGLAWGALSLFYLAATDPQISSLFYILISTVLAAAVPVLAASLTAFVAYTLPPVLMLIMVTAYQVFSQQQASSLPLFLVAGLTAYYLFMISLVRRANQNITDSFRLQQSHEALLADLQWEVAQRESQIEARTLALTEANTRLSEKQAHLQKLSRAVEASPNGIIITDRQGFIEYVNPRCEKITGYSQAEALGKTPRLFKVQFSNPGRIRSLWQTIQAGRQWVGEFSSRRHNGPVYWAKVYIAPIRSVNQEISHFVAILEDVSEAHSLAQALSHQATHDPLTGLINRSEFERRLTALNLQNTDQHALCYLDLDLFKVINETAGHTAGDALLSQLSGYLSQFIGPQETLARLGGDEFALLMESSDLEHAKTVAEEIRYGIDSFTFFWQSKELTTTASIGVAMIEDEASNNADKDPLKRAESACNAAKQFGRNCVYVFQNDDAMLAEQSGEFQWVQKIKHALSESRLMLYTQPIQGLHDNANTLKYEVLLRMRDETDQIISPGVFLPIAERYNLADKIDRWVIDTVIDWLTHHHQALPFNQTLAINLSGSSMGNQALLTHISQRLHDAVFPVSMLSFEITETAAIANVDQAKQFIQVLRNVGCHFALDDFGSGLSSFAYLKNLPVSAIKIDGLFVRDMLTDPIDAQMVRAINEIGHVMGLETIAEFVENAEVLHSLESIGVDYAQGFHIGKPAPIDSLLTTKTC
ncbi:diguanylate cyclase/phosphodiesterase [Methylophaga frappieri]|uniref:Diguanylate cyclase/phosphodiesterase n=1 Tax=Methylophaga frappieri (strain ATCC BAA-2434 / DSM 25690 / JAM7) TaxID=754477 RepID=I1YI55_METFJ|nr:EAL domain-containing protein [Methylophaga frappieri]AFJ02598.1 diguanylate cyclase/phosphodiesterase [Methylophaga frappieri]